jgi:hypothetical protein
LNDILLRLHDHDRDERRAGAQAVEQGLIKAAFGVNEARTFELVSNFERFRFVVRARALCATPALRDSSIM